MNKMNHNWKWRQKANNQARESLDQQDSPQQPCNQYSVPPPVFSGATTKPGECVMGALVNWNHRGNLVEVGDLESDGNQSFRVSISINFPTCLLKVSGDGLSLKSLGDFFLSGKLYI